MEQQQLVDSLSDDYTLFEEYKVIECFMRKVSNCIYGRGLQHMAIIEPQQTFDRFVLNEVIKFRLRKITDQNGRQYVDNGEEESSVVTLVGSLPKDTVSPVHLSIFKYDLLVRLQYIVYMANVPQKFNSGLVIVAPNKFPFQQLILDVDFASNLNQKPTIQLFRQRDRLCTALIFQLLRILHMVDNLDDKLQKDPDCVHTLVASQFSVTARPNKLNFHLYLHHHFDLASLRVTKDELRRNFQTTIVRVGLTKHQVKLDDGSNISVALSRNHQLLDIEPNFVGSHNDNDSLDMFKLTHSQQHISFSKFYNLNPLCVYGFQRETNVLTLNKSDGGALVIPATIRKSYSLHLNGETIMRVHENQNWSTVYPNGKLIEKMLRYKVAGGDGRLAIFECVVDKETCIVDISSHTMQQFLEYCSMLKSGQDATTEMEDTIVVKSLSSNVYVGRELKEIHDLLYVGNVTRDDANVPTPPQTPDGHIINNDDMIPQCVVNIENFCSKSREYFEPYDFTCFPFTQEQCEFITKFDGKRMQLCDQLDRVEQVMCKMLLEYMQTSYDNYYLPGLILLASKCSANVLDIRLSDSDANKLEKMIHADRPGGGGGGKKRRGDNTVARQEEDGLRTRKQRKRNVATDGPSTGGGDALVRQQSPPPHKFSLGQIQGIDAILRELILFGFSRGAVSSTLSLLMRIQLFKNIYECVKFLVCRYSSTRLNPHTMYILTKLAGMNEEAARGYITSSFKYDDIAHLVFHTLHQQIFEKNEKKLRSSLSLPINCLYVRYVKMVELLGLFVSHELANFFFVYICGGFVMGGKNFIFYSYAYMMVRTEDFRNMKYVPTFPRYEMDQHALNYAIVQRDIGVLNTMFNVVEHAGPALRTLVSVKLHDQVKSTVDTNLLKHRFYPRLQTKIFEILVKSRTFIDVCRHNVMYTIMVCPIVPPLDTSEDDNHDYTLSLPRINYFDTSYTVLLHDFTLLEKNPTFWDNNFLRKLSDPHFSQNPFVSYVKHWMLIFYLASQNYNVTFASVVVFVQKIFSSATRGHLENHTKCSVLGITNTHMMFLHRVHKKLQTCAADEMMGDGGITHNNNVLDGLHLNDECQDGDNEDNADGGDVQMEEAAATHYVDNQDGDTLFYELARMDVQCKRNEMKTADLAYVQQVLEKSGGDGGGGDESLASSLHQARNLLHKLHTTKVCLQQLKNTNHDVELTSQSFEKVLALDEKFVSERKLCTQYRKIIANVNVGDSSVRIVKFVLMFATWCLKMGTEHWLKNSAMFGFIRDNADQLYQSMVQLLQCDHYAPTQLLLRFDDLDTFVGKFQEYCERHTVDMDSVWSKITPDIDNGLFYNQVEYTRLKNTYPEVFARERDKPDRQMDDILSDKYTGLIYNSVALLILNSEFHFDTLIDYWRFVLSLLIKGNINRRALYIYGITQSSKSRFTNLVQEIMATDYSSTVNSSNLSRTTSQDFDMVAVNGAFNTLLFFDEVDEVSLPRVKQIINSAPMSSRDIHGNESSSFRISFKPIFTGQRAVSGDKAMCARFYPIQKRYRYGPMDTGHPMDRLIDMKNDERVPDIVGGMVLSRRLPEWTGGTEAMSLFLLQNFSYPIFYYSAEKPISKRVSSTMENSIKRYIQYNDPVSYFINTVELTPSSSFTSKLLTDNDIYTYLHEWYDTNKSRFGRLCYDATKLKQELGPYFDVFRVGDKYQFTFQQ